ncbi:MAG: 4Fe-4S binding protein [Pontiellaceae bacterium]|nr:4Fe-4S binding protein [Pontiellaceae bacterium]
MNRRKTLKIAGQLIGVSALGTLGARLFSAPAEDAVFTTQKRRYAWQINPEKCTACGRCATHCVRKPSAAKAVNNLKACNNCVACYGHIADPDLESEMIDSGKRICPVDAVQRFNLTGEIDGYFEYKQDHAKCIGCARCVKQCVKHNQELASMFMIIRPDLCLGCNECSIAKACPSQAIERVPLEAASTFQYPLPFTYL